MKHIFRIMIVFCFSSFVQLASATPLKYHGAEGNIVPRVRIPVVLAPATPRRLVVRRPRPEQDGAPAALAVEVSLPSSLPLEELDQKLMTAYEDLVRTNVRDSQHMVRLKREWLINSGRKNNWAHKGIPFLSWIHLVRENNQFCKNSFPLQDQKPMAKMDQEAMIQYEDMVRQRKASLQAFLREKQKRYLQQLREHLKYVKQFRRELPKWQRDELERRDIKAGDALPPRAIAKGELWEGPAPWDRQLPCECKGKWCYCWGMHEIEDL